MRRLICRLFGHSRSRRHVRRSWHGWRSRCRLCGTPLFRIAPGVWRTETGERR